MAEKSELSAEFARLLRVVAQDNWKVASLEFDEAQRQFEADWEEVYEGVKDTPKGAADAAKALIAGQTGLTALTLAMARFDAVELFPRFRHLLEFISNVTAGTAGYKAVAGIPHLQAGFLYMAASVCALCSEAWRVFDKLLTARFQYYYQSGRPLSAYGFDHVYFFHSEAVSRRSDATHDLFRDALKNPEIERAIGAAGEGMIDAYVQTQMVMCLKAEQLREAGEVGGIWPDFGRFYGERVVPLLDRAYADREFGAGLCRPFREEVTMFFASLNARLNYIASKNFSGGTYLYESLASWEPR